MLSVETIQTYLGVTGDTAYLTQLERFAAADLSAWLAVYLGEPRNFVDVLDGPIASTARLLAPRGGDDPQQVWLSQPIHLLPDFELADLTISERASPTADWTELDQDDGDGHTVFELAGKRLRRLIGAWPEGRRTVQVAYNFGFEEDGAPDVLQGLALDLIQSRYRPAAMRALPAGITSISIRGSSVDLADPTSLENSITAGIPPAIRARLAVASKALEGVA